MYSMMITRGGSALSIGCQGVTSRSSSKIIGAPLAVMCSRASLSMRSSLHLTAARSASASMHLRHAHSSSLGGTSSLSFLFCKGRPRFGNWIGRSTAAWNSAESGITASSAALRMEISSSSHTQNALLPIDNTDGMMGSSLGGAAAMAVTSQGILHDGANGQTGSGWSAKELNGGILLAALAGSALLGPLDGLRRDIVPGIRGEGNGGPGGNNIGGPPVGGKYNDTFESPAEEGAGIAVVPRPYEVSVKALRGGRISMEDEFVVVGHGRLSAVFDGHGGGGVSKYLRDHLHVILSDNLGCSSKFQGDLIRPMRFRKSCNAQCEGRGGNKYDFSTVGQLPISVVAAALKDSFDQIDKEVLHNDQYDYQGSTAVATLLHEANDGTRTLLSANIGDSRGILSRDGTAIDLTRDHKPSDDKEKDRILAMGEKIEWDHYCKLYRVRNLSLSRAVGDRFAKPVVSGEVEIKQFPIYDDKDEFIVLASDGLWDVMSSQEVVSYVHRRLNALPKDPAGEEDMVGLMNSRRKNMSRFIANEALRRGSCDNISVVMVWLSEFDNE